MKYTLLAFELHISDVRNPITKELTELGRLLEQTASQRAEVCAGVYVFETQKGWLDMHRLRVQLESMKKPFVELPFEGSIAGFFSPAIANRLRELGKSNGQEIALLNLSPG